MAEGDITVTGEGVENLFIGGVDLVDDTIKVALYSAANFDVDSTAYTTTAEINYTNYVAKGETIVCTVVDVTASDRVEWRGPGTNTTWTNLGAGTILQAGIFDDTATAAGAATVDDVLMAAMEIGTNSNGGDYSIDWAADGIYRIAYS